MTTLTAYGTNTAAATITTADTLIANTTGAVAGIVDTSLGVLTGWGELPSQGSSAVWPALGAIGAASGKGWLLDATTLEGQQFIAGNWTPTVKVQQTAGASYTADLVMRAFVRSSGGVYTQIISSTLAAQSITSTLTTYVLPATAGLLTILNTGDKLYMDFWQNVTVGSGNALTVTRYDNASSSTQGRASCMQLVTPGYQAQPGLLNKSRIVLGEGLAAGSLLGSMW